MVKIPGYNLIVDGFKYSNEIESPNTVFFLTHMHSDHYQGLSSTWNKGSIYCSHQTAILLKDMYNIPSIIPLELDVTHWIILDPKKKEGVNVTLMDANHCVGSVMILFQGQPGGTILYTGDFRYKPEMLENKCLLNSLNQLIHIDHLYLDNTFDDPEFNFPSQEVCYDMIIKAIEENPKSDIWIKIECFGREQLLLDLANYFKTVIVVDWKIYRRIQLLGMNLERFVMNESDGYIRVVGGEQMKGLRSRNVGGIKTVGIWLSGWCKVYSKTIGPEAITYKVPYSLHSNYNELIEFTSRISKSKLTCTSSCSKKSKGYYAMIDHTYSNLSLETAPNVPIIPVKRKLKVPSAAILTKKKKPNRFGSKII